MSQPDAEVVVRFVEEDDLDMVLDAEREFNTFLDPDFDAPQSYPFTWTVRDYMETLKQRRSVAKGTYDTRTWVAEVAVDVGEATGGEDEYLAWVCGVLSVELKPDGYEVLNLAVHPEAPKEVLEALVQHLLDRAYKSQTRRKVTTYVSDYHYGMVAFWQGLGAEVSLLRDHFKGNIDAWKCVYVCECLTLDGKKEAV